MWQRWTEEEKERLRSFYGKVKTEELAAQMGRTVKQIREAAKRFCKLKKRNRYRKYRKQFLQLHRDGMNTYRIAETLNLPTSTVEFWMKKKNLRGSGHDAESWLRAKQTKRYNRITKNINLIWKCLLKSYPTKDRDPRVNRFGTFEDLVQECTFHILRKCMQFEPKRGKLSTWIYTIVSRHAFRALHTAGTIRSSSHYQKDPDQEEVDRREKARNVRSISDQDYWVAGEDGRSNQELLHVQEQMRKAIDLCLSPDEAKVIRMTYYKSATEKEVGKKFRMTVPYVKMLKRRAMGKLREFMEKQNAV